MHNTTETRNTSQNDVRTMRNNFRALKTARSQLLSSLGVEANQLFKRAREAPKPKPWGGARPPGAQGPP